MSDTNYAKIKTCQDYIIRLRDTAWIPLDSGNRDYNDFLQYLADNGKTIDDLDTFEP